MKAVILAGGEGRRLLPYTTVFPKPMMPVGQRPILEIILSQLKAAGITDIIIAAGHMEELIRAFFQDGQKLGISIRYSREEAPLGTAGPLSLIRHQLPDTFLLMNGDILTDLDFARLVEHHSASQREVTLVLARRSQMVDFGVVHLAPTGEFESWDEKPVVQYVVSAGIYMMESSVLDHVPDNTFFNLPDLITSLNTKGLRIKSYIHEGYWLDIGRPSDYEKACADSEELSLW